MAAQADVTSSHAISDTEARDWYDKTKTRPLNLPPFEIREVQPLDLDSEGKLITGRGEDGCLRLAVVFPGEVWCRFYTAGTICADDRAFSGAHSVRAHTANKHGCDMPPKGVDQLTGRPRRTARAFSAWTSKPLRAAFFREAYNAHHHRGDAGAAAAPGPRMDVSPSTAPTVSPCLSRAETARHETPATSRATASLTPSSTKRSADASAPGAESQPKRQCATHASPKRRSGDQPEKDKAKVLLACLRPRSVPGPKIVTAEGREERILESIEADPETIKSEAEQPMKSEKESTQTTAATPKSETKPSSGKRGAKSENHQDDRNPMPPLAPAPAQSFAMTTFAASCASFPIPPHQTSHADHEFETATDERDLVKLFLENWRAGSTCRTKRS